MKKTIKDFKLERLMLGSDSNAQEYYAALTTLAVIVAVILGLVVGL